MAIVQFNDRNGCSHELPNVVLRAVKVRHGTNQGAKMSAPRRFVNYLLKKRKKEEREREQREGQK